MIFKEERIEQEYWKLHPRLRLILSEIDYWCSQRNVVPVATCFIRTEEEQRALYEAKQAPEPTSVHCTGRGADLRVLQPEILNEQLIRFINTKFIYDDSRPNLKTMIKHGGTGEHLHVQCVAL